MRVGVIGGGLMGSGIAEVCARSGVDVTVVEVDDERCEKSQQAIARSLDRGVRGGHVSEDDRSAAAWRATSVASFRSSTCCATGVSSPCASM